jgi:putative ABC transport system permease protein
MRFSWRQLTRGLRALMHPGESDRDITDEVQHYLDQATEAHLADGLSRVDARRAARLELGGVTNVREQIRGAGWEHGLETTWGDIRYAARRVRAAPGFTLMAVVTLALGLGGTTTIFSAVKPVLFEPLPYPDPGRVTAIWEVTPEAARNQSTFGMFRQIVEQTTAFDAVAVLRSWQPTMTGPDQPERFGGQRVSADYLSVLGVTPALGRFFDPSDDQLGGPNVVVLSDGLWRRRFGGDRAVVGRTIVLDDDPYMVVGIMPRDFENVLAPATDIWAPLQYDMSQGRAWGHSLRMIGRLRKGMSLDRAAAELDATGKTALAELRPETYGRNVIFEVVSLQADLTRGVKPALLAIIGAVTLVLVMACVNVANLLLARDAHRHGEFALRSALGAGVGRLVRQLLTETLMLAALGGLVGMALAFLGVRALLAMSPADLPRANAIGVDGGVFVFAFVATTLVGLICGGVVAVRATRGDTHSALQHESSRTLGGHRRIRGLLVVSEVALAFTLLVSSGLLLRSLNRLLAVDAGFDGSHLLTMQVQTSGKRFDEDSTTYRFFFESLDAVRRIPGVMAASLTSQLPLSGDYDLYGVHFDPPVTGDPGEIRGTFRYAVSPDYFQTMGIPLRRGRLLADADRAGAPLVALVSESLARRRLPGRDPIGLRLRIGDGPLYTVIGVVGDVKQVSLALSETEAVYVTAEQWRFAEGAMSLVVRARNDATSLAAPVREAIWAVDKDQPIVRVAAMEDLVAASAAQRRFALVVFEVFAVSALLLAAAGMFGVLSGSVAERTREMGLRAAMGATRVRIIALVVRQGLALTGMGIAIGVAVATGTTRTITSLLFGLSPLDTVTYLGVIGLLVAVALSACGVPAWRAARVDPASALRAE